VSLVSRRSRVARSAAGMPREPQRFRGFSPVFADARGSLTNRGERFRSAYWSRFRAFCGLFAVSQTITTRARSTRFLDKPFATRYLVTVRIGQTARKHGIADEDMHHAVRNPIAQWQLDDDFTMRVGPARDGDLLEIGVLGIDTDDPVMVHAMRARPQYLPHR
jgi:hypothetical protein